MSNTGRRPALGPRGPRGRQRPAPLPPHGLPAQMRPRAAAPRLAGEHRAFATERRRALSAPLDHAPLGVSTTTGSREVVQLSVTPDAATAARTQTAHARTPARERLPTLRTLLRRPLARRQAAL